jgi:4-hydroxybenzoate polyprenyltransferase
MVLNDVFDANLDAAERPNRPLPSQRVAHRSAMFLGWGLLLCGVLLAAHLGYHGNSIRTTVVAIALAACIVLYDASAKRTSFGPIVMGSSRALNVILGMSLAAEIGGMGFRSLRVDEVGLAAGIGIYVAGVTIFARGEAATSERSRLLAGLAIIAAGIFVVANAPNFTSEWTIALGMPKWLLLWLLIAAVILRRCLLAWRDPRPESVQQAVRTCLRSIIVIDAAITLGYCGPFWGCAVLALLAPTLLLERWASTT